MAQHGKFLQRLYLADLQSVFYGPLLAKQPIQLQPLQVELILRLLPTQQDVNPLQFQAVLLSVLQPAAIKPFAVGHPQRTLP
jgi:hypothetical protein